MEKLLGDEILFEGGKNTNEQCRSKGLDETDAAQSRWPPPAWTGGGAATAAALGVAADKMAAQPRVNFY